MAPQTHDACKEQNFNFIELGLIIVGLTVIIGSLINAKLAQKRHRAVKKSKSHNWLWRFIRLTQTTTILKTLRTVARLRVWLSRVATAWTLVITWANSQGFRSKVCPLAHLTSTVVTSNHSPRSVLMSISTLPLLILNLSVSRWAVMTKSALTFSHQSSKTSSGAKASY